MSEYVKDLMAQVKEKNPVQPEFHQAVQEVAESLAVVLDQMKIFGVETRAVHEDEVRIGGQGCLGVDHCGVKERVT